MRLLGQNVLLVLIDGLQVDEILTVKRGLEGEGAVVLTTTPRSYITLRVERGESKNYEMVVDIPFEAISEYVFEGLLLPDGLTQCNDTELLVLKSLVVHFQRRKRPIFASGSSADLIQEDLLGSGSLVVREGTTLSGFVDRAVEVLSETAPAHHVYRPTMAA